MVTGIMNHHEALLSKLTDSHFPPESRYLKLLWEAEISEESLEIKKPKPSGQKRDSGRQFSSPKEARFP